MENKNYSDTTIKCEYCGRTRRCVGGFYYPIFEECVCSGERRIEAAERERRIEAAERRASETCDHNWVKRVQDGVGYYYCPRCGAYKL